MRRSKITPFAASLNHFIKFGSIIGRHPRPSSSRALESKPKKNVQIEDKYRNIRELYWNSSPGGGHYLHPRSPNYM